MSKNRLDALGDRLKAYESIETSQVFPPNCFLYVRIDEEPLGALFFLCGFVDSKSFQIHIT